MKPSDTQSLELASKGGTYSPVSVTNHDTVGATFLGVIALILLAVFLRVQRQTLQKQVGQIYKAGSVCPCSFTLRPAESACRCGMLWPRCEVKRSGDCMSALALQTPNSLPAIQARVNSHLLNWTAPLGMLLIRSVLFVGFQALIALALAQMGIANVWDNSAAWWTLTATLTNLVCLVLLIVLFRREGMHYMDLLRLEHGHIGRDLLMAIGLILISLPVAFLPNIISAAMLFGDPAQAATMLFRPLPAAAALPLVVLFPVTVALAELPTYFGYVMPRLEILSGKMWFAVGLAAFFFSFPACHVTPAFGWTIYRMAAGHVPALFSFDCPGSKMATAPFALCDGRTWAFGPACRVDDSVGQLNLSPWCNRDLTFL